MIKSIIYKSDKFIYSVIFEYFYSFLVRFCHRNGIEYLNVETLVLEKSNLLDFKEVVKYALKELVEECYEEPSHKQRSKFGSRYQKIYVDGIQYVVNYRTDYIGINMYGLHYLLTWIEKHITEEGIMDTKPIA